MISIFLTMSFIPRHLQNMAVNSERHYRPSLEYQAKCQLYIIFNKFESQMFHIIVHVKRNVCIIWAGVFY